MATIRKYIQNFLRIAAPLWGIIGVSIVLLYSIGRLAEFALEAINDGLTIWQTIVLILVVVFMAYSEGYRGFHLRFSPRVVARALYLHRFPTVGNSLLAPLFCVGYFAATRRTLMTIWGGTLAIIGLVLLVHQMSQPWRGILDAGVVVGLTWGQISLWMIAVRVFQEGRYRCSPEVPGLVVDPSELSSSPVRSS